MTTQILASSLAHDLALSDKATDPLPTSIVWMPAGTHAISATTLDGAGYAGNAICDEQAFRSILASFQKITASGQRVWLDFDHADGEAAAWVKSFSWDATKGILANIEWTAKGEQALRGKAYYSFSPAFAAEKTTGRVVQLLKGHAAGGLVNAPAFGAAMPALIAARMAAVTTNKTAPGGNPESTNMNEVLVKLLAALGLQAPANPTDESVIAVIAKHINTAKASPELESVKAQLATVQASIDAKAKAELEAVQAKVKADEKAAADKVTAQLAEANAQLAAIRAGATAAGAGPGIIQVTASVEDVLKGYAKFGVSDGINKGEFYERNISPVLAKMGGRRFSELVLAAIPVLAKNVEVQAANSLGTLAGTLVAQQSLALLKYEFPILGMVSSDYSNQSAKWNQPVMTRLKTAMAASQYTTGYTAGNATLTDVPVTINHHPYAQVAFNANELASSNRDLFGEQAEVVNYALALDITNAIYALFTAANFTITPLVLGGTGGGTAGATGVGYARASAVASAKALFKNLQPRAGRFNLLNADAFGGLGADPAAVSMASFLKPEIMTGYELPKIADMQPIQVVNLPATLNTCGVAGSPRAIAIATRVPNDYTQALPGASYGNVSQVTDPNTGITVAVTQYVDHNAGSANYRVAVMYGVAVGDPKGAVITYGA